MDFTISNSCTLTLKYLNVKQTHKSDLNYKRVGGENPILLGSTLHRETSSPSLGHVPG